MASKSEENKTTGNNLRLPKATIKNNQTENFHRKTEYNSNSLSQIVNLVAEVSIGIPHLEHPLRIYF